MPTTTDVLSFEAFTDSLGRALGRRVPAVEDVHLAQDCGWDSLTMLETLAFLESLGAPVPHEAAGTMTTLGDVYEHYRVHAERTVRGHGAPVAPLRPRSEPSPLAGRWVRLRPITPGDYETLYEISTRDTSLVSWRFRGAPPSPDQFIGSLWSGVLVQFAIIDGQHGGVIGVVTCYNANLRSGVAYVAILGDSRAAREGWQLEGLALFLRYIFRQWPLRKVYFESLEPNYKAFEQGAGRLFSIEGRLEAYEFLDGSYVDVVIGSIHRDNLSAIERLLGPA